MRWRNVMTNLRRRWILVGGLVALLLALSPVAAIIASAPLRDFVYREISYMLVTDRVVGDERDPEQIALKLNEFIAENVYPGGGPVLDTNSWNDLIRGIGWCDQDAWLLGTLLATRDIHGKIVFLEGEGGAPQHTVAEVLLNDDWRVLDPLYGLSFRREGGLATYADLSSDPRVTTLHPDVQALPQVTRTALEDFFFKLYSNPAEPGRWSSLLNSKYGSRPRLALRQATRGYLTVLGAWGARRFQDIYLALLPDQLGAYDEAIRSGNRPVFRTEKEDPALFLFYRARNYHLYARADEAERLYREIQESYPSSYYAEKSAYFLGLLQFTLRGQPKEALDQLSAFVRQYPESTWLPLAHDMMGTLDEQLGDVPSAIEHYRAASGDQWVKAGSRLAHLQAPVAAVP